MNIIIEKIEKQLLYIALAIILLYLSPFFIMGQDAYVLIHDNLDSTVIWLKVLTQSGKLFSSNPEPLDQIMSGTPRVSFGSEYSILVWLNYFFSPFIAYVLNQFLMHYVAFGGMYLLLKKILPKERDLIIVGTSLCFALLPFWPSGALTVAGQPLALFAFLNIRENQASIRDWIVIILLPFFSSFVLSFVFFLSILGLFCLYEAIIYRKLNWKWLFAILLMTIVFLFVEYRLVTSMILKDGFLSHRTEMLIGGKTGIEAIRIFWKDFTTGQYHAASLQKPFILLAVVFALLLGFNKKYWRPLFLLFISALIIAAVFALYQWTGIDFLKEKYPLIRAFNFGRYHWLHPLVWYIAFALSLNILRKKRFGVIVVFLLMVLQISFSFYNSDFIQERSKNNITYREFYSEKLFRDIANQIGDDKRNYRVVSIGLHPSIAQYNGFYTLDGYLANYPLEYKKQFREIIEGELDKSAEIQQYYDSWGSRFYIFSCELEGKGFLIKRNQDLKIQNLDFNRRAFTEMGGKYIFSAVEIVNARELGFILENKFESEDSPWCIYLYRAVP